MGPHYFALAHGNAAGHLRQVFTESALQDQGFKLPQAAFALERFGPTERLAQGLYIGAEPGKTMGARLVRFQGLGRNPAVLGEPRRQRRPRIGV